MSSPRPIWPHLLSIVATGLVLVGCGGDSGPSEPGEPLPDETILVAGNIATCGTTNDELTASLLDTLPGTIFTLGDNAFPDGSIDAYKGCYDPSWGRHKSRTYAALGNHEYASGSAEPSFDYFGSRAGPRDLGYYSLDLGNWHIIVLNVNDVTVNQDLPFEGSIQDQWLTQDLKNHSRTCTLVIAHNPRFFSSDTIGWTSNAYVTSLWRRLYDNKVDVVLSGQQHDYERLAPLTPTGSVDAAAGVREFNVGTGGESTETMTAVAEHSEVRSDAFGILKLTLGSGTYDWQFVPALAGQFSDTGTGTCH
jgi:acid phosphatase type 7